MTTQVNTEGSWCAGHLPKLSVYIRASNPHSHPLSRCYHRPHFTEETLRQRGEVTYPGRGQAGIPPQAAQPQILSPPSPCYLVCSKESLRIHILVTESFLARIFQQQGQAEWSTGFDGHHVCGFRISSCR